MVVMVTGEWYLFRSYVDAALRVKTILAGRSLQSLNGLILSIKKYLIGGIYSEETNR